MRAPAPARLASIGALLLAGSSLSASPAPGDARSPPVKSAAKTAAGAAGLEPLSPRFKLRAERGFFDDPLAIDAGAHRLALVRTDTASFAEVEVVDLETGKIALAFPAGAPTQTFEQIHFAPDARGLVVVGRDAASGRRLAQYFDPAGKPAGLAGPASEFAAAVLAGERVLVGLDVKPDGKGGAVYTIAAYRLDGLPRVDRPRAYKVNKDGEVAGTGFKMVSWQEGFSRLVGLRAGGFDKQRDIRVPDRAASFDTLRGTVVSEKEIGDVMAWARLSELRKQHPNRSAFVSIDGEQAGLDLVDADGNRSRLSLAVDFPLYDPESLCQQEGEQAGERAAAGRGGLLYFSLTIDPVNPEAVRRGKADRPFLDVYSTDASAGAAPVHRGRIPAPDDRPAAWAAAFGRIAVLRKHKGFARGGEEVEVYDLH